MRSPEIPAPIRNVISVAAVAGQIVVRRLKEWADPDRVLDCFGDDDLQDRVITSEIWRRAGEDES